MSIRAKTGQHFPHDMGGEKDGAIFDGAPPHGDEPIFKEEWHARSLAITVLAGAHGKWNLDESRHIRETLPPEDYTRFSYYEKWLSGLANLLVRHGLITRDELKSGEAEDAPMAAKTLRADEVRPAMDKGGPSGRDVATPPKFKIGDAVMTITPDAAARVQDGHTRLPHYASEKSGVVVAHHGGHVLPDSNAHDWQTGDGEAPEHLYAVQFKAADLWPDDGAVDPPRQGGGGLLGELFEMSAEDDLNPLPFDEPWQAEVFALTTHLNESGIFTWSDWADRFGANLAASPSPVEGGHDYYTIWLDTLLQLLIELGHAKPEDVEAMKAQWIDAYERTPHGEPVHLAEDTAAD